jgi:hypothetical protein
MNFLFLFSLDFYEENDFCVVALLATFEGSGGFCVS